MIKKELKYRDPFDGHEVTETAYFHMTQVNLMELEVEVEGGLQALIQHVSETNDPKEIMRIIKLLIAKSYGQRTSDGRFVKDQAKTDSFMSGEAFSEFFMDLVTDAEAAAAFVSGIVPSGIEERAAKITAANQAAQTPALTKAENALGGTGVPEVDAARTANAEHENKADPTGLTEHVTPQVLTEADLRDMDPFELRDGLRAGRYKIA